MQICRFAIVLSLQTVTNCVIRIGCARSDWFNSPGFTQCVCSIHHAFAQGVFQFAGPFAIQPVCSQEYNSAVLLGILDRRIIISYYRVSNLAGITSVCDTVFSRMSFFLRKEGHSASGRPVRVTGPVGVNFEISCINFESRFVWRLERVDAT